MNLSISNLKAIKATGVVKPDEKIFDLPEKVLQFGTGVLLRGLPDYFIDKANRQGLFGGRVVVIKSTDGGDAGAFDRQDGLYTLCIRGIEEGKKKEEREEGTHLSPLRVPIALSLHPWRLWLWSWLKWWVGMIGHHLVLWRLEWVHT